MGNGSPILPAATYVEKGGTGKTTSAAHIAVAADHNHDLDVLLIDLAGTQNDLSTQFGLDIDVDDLNAPISAIFGDNWGLIEDEIDDVAQKMIYETDEGIDLIPADPGLGGADNQLANLPREDRYHKLEAFVADHIADDYDIVLFDLPGKEDNIALNGLFAAEHTIAPLKPGAFERAQLHNLESNLEELRDAYPVSPVLEIVIPTMIDGRRNMHSEFVDELQEAYPERVTDPVPAAADIGNEQARGRTLYALEDDELYDTGQRARDAYNSVTDQLLDSIQS